MTFDQLVKDIVTEFRADPRNKVFASESLLLASVEEGTGEKISSEQLRALVEGHQSGSLDGDDLEILDRAVYVCDVLASCKFSSDKMQINWRGP